MKLLNLLVILLTFFTLTLNSFAAPSNSPSAIYTEDKPNIMVTPDQPVFVIQLKSNPTTGYSWFLREYDSHFITPVKHNFKPPAKNLIGAPGFEVWTFRVKPDGFTVPQQTTIRMIYARPWQANDTPKLLVFPVSTMVIKK